MHVPIGVPHLFYQLGIGMYKTPTFNQFHFSFPKLHCTRGPAFNLLGVCRLSD